MIQKLSLYVDQPDNALTGEARLVVSQWGDDSTLQASCLVWKGVCIMPTMEEAGSHYTWAAVVLAEMVGRASEGVRSAIEEGQVKPMVDQTHLNVH